MALPKKIFVYEVKDGDERYLAACRELTEVPDDEEGELVGQYTLSKKGKFIVTKIVELED